MTWFKVDDGFWRHRKVMRMAGARRLMAAGAWVIAGSWSSDQLTDGRIGQEDLHAIFPGVPTRMLTAAFTELVKQGLWEERPGGGWQFHNWAGNNPEKAAIERRREADRERKARQRRDREGRYLSSVPDGKGQDTA